MQVGRHLCYQGAQNSTRTSFDPSTTEAKSESVRCTTAARTCRRCKKDTNNAAQNILCKLGKRRIIIFSRRVTVKQTSVRNTYVQVLLNVVITGLRFRFRNISESVSYREEYPGCGKLIRGLGYSDRLVVRPNN